MTIKKILSLGLGLAMLPVSAFAYPLTTNEVIFDENGYVVLEGTLEGAKADTKIFVSVLADGDNMEDVPENNQKLAYVNEIFTDENGAFLFKFKMNDKRVETGKFSINLFGENVDVAEKKSFLYTTAADLAEINGVFEKDFTKDDIAKLLGEYAENIKLTPFNLFDEMNGGILLNNLYTEAKAQGIDNLDDFKKLVWVLAYVEAFNQGKNEFVIESGYNLKNIEQLELADEGLFEKFTENVNENGRKIVLDSVVNNAYKNYSEWYADFGESLFVQRIVNSTSTGYAHVKEILAEDEVYDLDLRKYNDLSETNKRKAESKLVSKSAETIAELQNNLDDIINDITANKKPSSGGGGGGSSSGSSGLPYIGSDGTTNDNVTLHVTEKEEKEDQKEDNKTETVSYSDMENYAWAKEAVGFLNERGIVKGTCENKFSPESYLTREQAVKILCLAAGLEKTDKVSEFSDVADDAWYAEFVAMASDKGIVKGISETEFGVGRKITRQDFAVMITRTFGLSESGNGEQFADYETISSYAKEAMGTLILNGVITGYSDNTIKPTQNLTRAEAAVMIYRLILKKGG